MRILAVAIALLAVSACGFRPMYGPSSEGAVIGPVQVAEIDGRAGHALGQELSRLLTAEANRAGPTRVLEVTLTESVSRLGYRIDESARRADLIVVANYRLLTPGQPDLTGRLTTTVGFDIPDSAFGEITAQDDARDRAGEALAHQLRTEIALRLRAAQP
jgi:LPS-assembly lipoprotein